MKEIGIIGSGAMGAGIAQVAAAAGHQVFVYDNNQAALDKAKSNLQSTLNKLVEKQKLTEQVAKDNYLPGQRIYVYVGKVEEDTLT